MLTTGPSPNPENPFERLRNKAFTTTPEQLGLSLNPFETAVYGIVMDWGVEGATATTVSFGTGDASLYLSSGGGVIGGGKHPNVSHAAKKFVEMAHSYLDKTSPNTAMGLPILDEVRFYLLTNKGVFEGMEIMENFENNTSIWLPLFVEGNKVLTELQLTTGGL